MSIRELIEAVEAGSAGEGHFARAFPSESAYGRCTWHDAIDAYRKNSVDAALALMQAVLPGRRVQSMYEATNGSWGVVTVERETNYNPIGAGSDTPARALLLAILKAKEGDTP